MIVQELASMIDHTLLKPTATDRDIIKLCEEAKEHGFFSVCVPPYYVSLASRSLKMLKDAQANQNIQNMKSPCVCAVIGFPLGYHTTETKVKEAYEAIQQGAQEIDMVININALKSQYWDFIKKDIESVVSVASTYFEDQNIIVKVIVETALLTEEELKKMTSLVQNTGADFIKTSTGFSSRGASLRDIELIKNEISSELKIKASGGIRDWKTAQQYIDAGVHRLGMSASVSIIQEFKGA